MDARDRIRDFIKQEILFEEEPAGLSDDTPLLDGIMDSLGLMQLVAFLEEEFDIELDDADITAEHFRTLGHIAEFVNGRAGQR